MKPKKEYIFGNSGKIAQSLIVITGVARSGTSILGKLIASFKGMDYEYEPWVFAQVPVLSHAGILDQENAAQMLAAFSQELYLTHLLGRGVNLRPTDDSRVTLYQPESDLQYKWKNLRGRPDALAFAAKVKRQMAVKMVNLQPCYGLLARAFPKMKLIHIVRNGMDVASSIAKKRWFSDAALNRTDSLSMKKEVKRGGKIRILPWWVKREDEDDFLKASEFGRGLCCWRTLLSYPLPAALRKQSRYLEVRYEDLISDPEQFARQVRTFLNIRPGVYTPAIIKSVDREKFAKPAVYDLKKNDRRELKKCLPIFKKLGYQAPAI